MKRVLCALLVCSITSAAEAAPRRLLTRGRAVRPVAVRAAAAEPIVVAPFAVPVAVPVATVQQPTLFYGVRQYVDPQLPAAAPPADVSTAATSASPATAAARPDDEKAVAILARHCAECHTGPGAKRGLAIFAADRQIVPRLPRHTILDMAAPDGEGRQRMPPGERPKLTEEEITALRQWAKLPRDAVY